MDVNLFLKSPCIHKVKKEKKNSFPLKTYECKMWESPGIFIENISQFIKMYSVAADP